MPIGIVVPIVLFMGVLLGWGGHKACSCLLQRTSVEEFERLACIDSFTLCNLERGAKDIDGSFDRSIVRGKMLTCIYVTRVHGGHHVESAEVIVLKTLARVKIVFEDGAPLTLGMKLGPLLPYDEALWYEYKAPEERMLTHVFRIVQNEARHEIREVAHHV